MLGLYLNHKCNQHCSFCFNKNSGGEISEVDFGIFLDWVCQNHPKEISIVGGEPTMHQHFVRFVQDIRRKVRVPVQVISNLVCEEEKLAGFHHCKVLANASTPLSDEDRAVFEKNLEAVVAAPGTRVCLSYTLHDLEQDEERIVQYCREFSIVSVRIEFARASAQRTNKFVTLDSIDPFKDKLLRVARTLTEADVAVNFDCAMPMDLFSKEEIESARIRRIHLVDPRTNVCLNVCVNADLTISACPFRVIDDRRLDQFKDLDALFTTVMSELQKKIEGGEKGPVLCMAERFRT